MKQGMTLSEELVWRGFVHQTTFKDIKELDEKKRIFYWGVDANSAPSMTIGNLAAAMMAKKFIDHGYQPILLAGGATGRIGDPKDDAERPEVTADTVESNKEGILRQYETIFKGVKLKMVDNFEWFKDIGYIEFLQTIGKQIGMGQMLDRDFVKTRTGEGGSGISYAEFSYALIQGFDFLHLFREENVTLQLCGSDQWINCLSGVEMVRKLEGESVHVWSCPLVINKATGKKFGKSEEGTIWLDPNMTSPFKFYQFWLNCDDEGVGDYIKIYTGIQKAEFDELMLKFNENRAERLAQKYLAFEVTKLVHGVDVAESIKRISEVLFSGRDVAELTSEDLKSLSVELPTSNTEDILDFLIDTDLAKSKGDARRFIEQGAVSINGQKIDDVELKLKSPSLVKKGKNSFAVKCHILS